MSKFKCWGKYQPQTARQDSKAKNRLIIREADNEIRVNKAEIPSLIIALLEMSA